LSNKGKFLEHLFRAVGAAALITFGVWFNLLLFGPYLGFVGSTSGNWTGYAALFVVMTVTFTIFLWEAKG
jgi:hypothetical protein